jgi:hypothetical protein
MGMTHSWERSTEVVRQSFARAVAASKRVVEHLQIPLAGYDGTGDPIFKDDAIVFNGRAPAACEAFEIHQQEFDRRGRNRFFQFAKTNHAPYDICVRVSLICFKHFLGEEIRVMSDAPDAEWEKARQVCHEVLGFGADFSLDK